ncbi:MAG: hypothetical protein AB7I30_20710, partial [Isosphaeraceae bacterium]
MTRLRRLRCRVAITLVVASWPLLSLGSRGQQPASPEGTERSLRLSPPYDLLSLSDGSVLKVEPSRPRPLPPYGPSKDPSRKTA